MIFILFIYISYFIFILWLVQGMKNIVSKQNYHNEDIFISIVIAIKNEGNNLEDLLNSLNSQTLSKNKFEIIFIDNQSTDKSLKILKKYKDKIENLNYYKSGVPLINWDKKIFSLSKGIELAKGNVILHTDGDCIPSENWAKSFYESFGNPKTGVVISRTPLKGIGFWGKILELENLYQDIFGATGISHNLFFTCNGRSLGYRKRYFDEVGGYDKISNIIGGDDDLLIHKIINEVHCEVKYLIDPKSSVYSITPKTFKSFFNQRVRYASKIFHLYRMYFVSKEIKIIMPFLFIVNLLSFYSLMSLSYQANLFLIIFILIKMIADYMLLYFFQDILNKKVNLTYFSILSLLHPFYIVIFPLISPFKKIMWKNN
tara:strand:- start:2312 stop:3427 length:1116 start_codon:yes stop_codon:yes gene_type:complete